MYKSALKILLADDHSYLKKGLIQELDSIGYSQILTCKDGKETLYELEHSNFDLAILDIEMPFYNGFEIVEHTRKKGIEIPIIFFSYHKEKSYIAVAKKLGVKGYMLKEDDIQQIDACIQHVLQGKSYYSRALSDDLFRNLENELENLSLLTNSEKKILKYIASGQKSGKISDILNISKRTVEKHRSNIISKLDPTNELFSLSHWAEKNRNLIDKL